jgi:hypothetical protein
MGKRLRTLLRTSKMYVQHVHILKKEKLLDTLYIHTTHIFFYESRDFNLIIEMNYNCAV